MLLASLPDLEVLDSLGRGHSGEVLRVRDASGQLRAAKVLHGLGSLSELDRHRFRREYQLLAGLRHPHIVRVYDFNEEVPYFTMELIRGPDLAGWVRQNQPLGSSFHELIRQILRALQALHEADVVHRDLKPANLMVDEGQRAVVMDFGVAHLGGSERLTAGSMVMGTPLYMAPEQMCGMPPDPRSDLYSLGAILYEAYGGRFPVQEGDPLVLAFQRVLTWNAEDIREYNKEVPAWMAGFIARLMARGAESRPASAEEARRELEEQMPGKFSSTGASSAVVEAAARGLFEPALAGRDASLAQIQDHLDGLLNGRGFVLMIRGESGSGKSRLLEETRRLAMQRGIRLYKSGCFEGDPTPYAAFLPLLRRALATLNEEERKFRLGRGLVVLARLLPEIEAQEEESRDDAAHERLRLFEAILRLINCLRRDGPCIFALDDLQWIDPAALDLMQFLTGRLAEDQGSPFALVGLYRSDEVSAGHPLLGVMEAVGRRLPLEVLDTGVLAAEDVQALASSMLGGCEVSPGLAQELLQTSGGNPLYVGELVRSLVQDGCFVFEDGRWVEAPQRGEALPTAPSMAALLERKLRRLGEGAADMLGAAAVLGKRFSWDLLSAVLGGGSFETLDRLLQARLMVECRDGAGADLMFYHDRFRELLLQGLSAPRRQHLHRQAAAAYQGESVAAERAYHQLQGGQRSEALQSLVSAAEQARASYANRKALGYYEQILQLDPDDKLRRLAEEGVADLNVRLGGAELALPIYARLLEGPASPEAKADLEFRRGIAHRGLGQYPEAIAAFTRALQHLGRGLPASRGALIASALWGALRHLPYLLRPPAPLPGAVSSPRTTAVLRICDYITLSYYWSVRLPHRKLIFANVFFTKFIQSMSGRVGGEQARALVLHAVGLMFRPRPPLGLARSVVTRGLAGAESVADPLLRAEVHRYGAWAQFQMNDFEPACKHANLAVDLARQVEDLFGLAQAYLVRSNVAQRLGCIDQCTRDGRHCARIGDETKDPVSRSLGRLRAARGLEILGQLDEVEAVLQEVEAIVAGREVTFDLCFIDMTRGLACLQAGQPERSLAYLEKACRDIRRVDLGIFWEATYDFYLADTLVALGRWDRLEAHLGAWRKRCRGLALFHGTWLRLSAQLRHARGRRGWEELFEQAIAVLEKASARDGLARALWFKALATRDAGHRQRAEQVLTEVGNLATPRVAPWT